MKLLLLLLLAAMTARADTGFHAYSSTINMIEGGRVETLIVLYGSEQATIRLPRNWSHQVDDARQKVIFQTASGKSAVIIQFTTNSPGALPAEGDMKAKVLAEHPGAAIFQFSRCPTSFGMAAFFDLVRVPAPQVIVKIRHAFVALPNGQAEFILSANDEEFEPGKTVLMRMLNSFQAAPVKPK